LDFDYVRGKISPGKQKNKNKKQIQKFKKSPGKRLKMAFPSV